MENLAHPYHRVGIIESVDSISRDEPDSLLKQYITNGAISRARYTITQFKHNHRVPQLISNRISVGYIAQVYVRTARSKKIAIWHSSF